MSVLSDIIEEKCELEMTPMIDVTFLLLIFFLCTIKFKTLEGKLSAYLPKDVGVNTTSAEPKEKVEIQIRVRTVGEKRDPRDANKQWVGKGRYQYVGRVVEYSVGPLKSTDLNTIQTRLNKLHEDDPERDATIDPRKGTVYADVVKVLDAALFAGFRSITFVGSYED